MNGGALYFTYGFGKNYDITNNTFTNWTAVTGGAIQNMDQVLNLRDNFFYNNTAENLVGGDNEIETFGDGGAIYNTWETPNWGSTFTNNVFSGNEAHHDGGAVKYIGLEPSGLKDNNTL